MARKGGKSSSRQFPSSKKQGNPPDFSTLSRALRGLLLILAVLTCTMGVVVAWMWQRAKMVNKTVPAIKSADPSAVAGSIPQPSLPQIPMTDITLSSGIRFIHEGGAQGEKLLPETMGSGCAFFDYDNDGDQDLLLVNSSTWSWNMAPPSRPTLALYQNDGTGHFTDATASVGLQMTLYGMGAAIGDYDNDGWDDLYLTAVGANRLFHNDRGVFREVTASAKVAGSEQDWSTGCAWLDYDRDGDLDLFVANYVQWSREIDLAQDYRLQGGGRAYGPPFAFNGTFPVLYRNEGDGKFTDVSEAAGVRVRHPATDVPGGKSLGVLPVDLDRDGWMDLVIANDTVQNFVLHNQRNGTFAEVGVMAGVAFDSAGNARGAMGIDAAYFRNDDSLGIAIGNFSNEMTALYVARGTDLQFTDEAPTSGLGLPSQLEMKFGVVFADFDLDGRLDLAVANGHLEEEIHQVQANQHYAQSPHLFWNAGPRANPEFILLKEKQVSSDFLKPMVGRGIAVADIDNDGDVDLLLTGNRSAPRLLRNDQNLGHHWLQIQLENPEDQKTAIGATVEILSGGQRQRRVVMPTRGYLSQSARPLTAGLGKHSKVDEIRITWPDGSRQTISNLPVDQRHTIIRQRTPPATS